MVEARRDVVVEQVVDDAIAELQPPKPRAASAA
jgi:hypothetical protein